jgi:hypothetical protein
VPDALPEGDEAAFSMDPEVVDGDADPVLSALPLLLLLTPVPVADADADPEALVGSLVAAHELASYSHTTLHYTTYHGRVSTYKLSRRHRCRCPRARRARPRPCRRTS